MKTDCKNYKQEAKESIPHRDVCDRWYVNLDVEGKMCKMCKENPTFVEKFLLPARILHYEKMYRIQKFGFDPMSPCDNELDSWKEDRLCCGGQIKKVEMIKCSLLGKTQEKSYCYVCNRQSQKK